MFNKVSKILTNGGFSAESVEKMMAAHFDYAVRTYPEAKARFIADVVSSL